MQWAQRGGRQTDWVAEMKQDSQEDSDNNVDQLRLIVDV